MSVRIFGEKAKLTLARGQVGVRARDALGHVAERIGQCAKLRRLPRRHIGARGEIAGAQLLGRLHQRPDRRELHAIPDEPRRAGRQKRGEQGDREAENEAPVRGAQLLRARQADRHHQLGAVADVQRGETDDARRSIDISGLDGAPCRMRGASPGPGAIR